MRVGQEKVVKRETVAQGTENIGMIGMIKGSITVVVGFLEDDDARIKNWENFLHGYATGFARNGK